LSIRIFYDKVSVRYKGWRELKIILAEIITVNSFKPGSLSIIITDDGSLRNINAEFLEHDYFTDVITFNYNKDGFVNGEIYISLDTVKRNSLNYNVSLNDELSRVVIHGVLHLIGFDDKKRIDKVRMRRAEDHWLVKLGEK
jgi:rRNA maturation RNase YbeY